MSTVATELQLPLKVNNLRIKEYPHRLLFCWDIQFQNSMAGGFFRKHTVYLTEEVFDILSEGCLLLRKAMRDIGYPKVYHHTVQCRFGWKPEVQADALNDDSYEYIAECIASGNYTDEQLVVTLELFSDWM